MTEAEGTGKTPAGFDDFENIIKEKGSQQLPFSFCVLCAVWQSGQSSFGKNQCMGCTVEKALLM